MSRLVDIILEEEGWVGLGWVLGGRQRGDVSYAFVCLFFHIDLFNPWHGSAGWWIWMDGWMDGATDDEDHDHITGCGLGKGRLVICVVCWKYVGGWRVARGDGGGIGK